MRRLAAATGLVVMWSSGFVGARLGTAHAAADTLLAWRYLAASAVLVLVLAAVRRRRASRLRTAPDSSVGGGEVGNVEAAEAATTRTEVVAITPARAEVVAGHAGAGKAGARTTAAEAIGVQTASAEAAGDDAVGSAEVARAAAFGAGVADAPPAGTAAVGHAVADSEMDPAVMAGVGVADGATARAVPAGARGGAVRRGWRVRGRSVGRWRGEYGRQAVLGLLCQCLYLAGVVTGVGLGVPAGLAALIAVLQPLVVGALAGPVLGERVGPRQWLGLGVGVGAVGLVVGGEVDGGGHPLGYVLVAGGMLALSTGTLLERRWRLPTPLLDSLTVHCLVSTAVFVGSATVAGRIVPPATAGFWWAVVWVVVLSTFGGYGCYLLSLRAFGATGVSTLLNLTPPTTMLWALLMFDERVGWLGLAGLLGCACSVRLVLSGNGRGTWRSIRRTRPDSSTRPVAGGCPSRRSPTATPRSARSTVT